MLHNAALFSPRQPSHFSALRWGSRPASSASSRRLRAPAAAAAAGGSAWCEALRISENCIEAQLRITSFPTVDQIRVRITVVRIPYIDTQSNSCMTSQQNATPTGSPMHGGGCMRTAAARCVRSERSWPIDPDTLAQQCHSGNENTLLCCKQTPHASALY